VKFTDVVVKCELLAGFVSFARSSLQAVNVYRFGADQAPAMCVKSCAYRVRPSHGSPATFWDSAVVAPPKRSPIPRELPTSSQ